MPIRLLALDGCLWAEALGPRGSGRLRPMLNTDGLAFLQSRPGRHQARRYSTGRKTSRHNARLRRCLKAASGRGAERNTMIQSFHELVIRRCPDGALRGAGCWCADRFRSAAPDLGAFRLRPSLQCTARRACSPFTSSSWPCWWQFPEMTQEAKLPTTNGSSARTSHGPGGLKSQRRQGLSHPRKLARTACCLRNVRIACGR